MTTDSAPTADTEIPTLPAFDADAFLNTPHLPKDAGEFAPGLSAMLARIPRMWGMWIGVSRGWWPIVIALDKSIAALYPDYEIHQVKEKFGTLRYYCSVDGTDGVTQLIRAAEAASAVTCEECGAPGLLGFREGWWRTTCTTHAPEGFVAGDLD